MCTVSFFNTGNSLIFTSNRDEKKDREKAVFPEVIALENNVLYFPKDKKAAGTWFVTDENGNVAILLNGAFQKHESKSSYRKSRGIILLDLAKSKNILHEFRNYDLLEIEPFQLLVFSQKELFRLLWDGNDKHEIMVNKDENHLLSSKTLYNDQIVNERKNIFENFQKEENINSDEILEFHKNHQIEKEPNIEEIIKEKFITVSITQLIITDQNIEFCYNDLTANTKQIEKIGKRTLV